MVQRAAEPKLKKVGVCWHNDVEDLHPINGSFISVFIKMYPDPHKLVHFTSVPEPTQLLYSFEGLLGVLTILSFYRRRA